MEKGAEARGHKRADMQAMRVFCAVVLQLASFYSLAGTTSQSLLVTVTVVRPAPVTNAIDAAVTKVTSSAETRAKPVTASTVTDAVRYITVDY
jgi:hypothetical protein